MPTESRFSNGRIVLVTGASSGIGAQTALLFARHGYTVYGASRRGTLVEGEPDNLHPLVMDVTSDDSVREGIQKIIDAEGRVDILIHAAGNGISGPVEYCTAADAHWQMDVNYYGAIRLLNAVLPGMRQQRQGHIILVGSVGGMVGLPFQTLYSGSKAALAALTMGLNIELHPFSIKCTLIEPGDVCTGFTDARRIISSDMDGYQNAFDRALKSMEHDERTGMSSEHVAKRIFKIAQMKNPPLERVVGAMYHILAFLIRIMPTKIVNFGLRLMYGG